MDLLPTIGPLLDPIRQLADQYFKGGRFNIHFAISFSSRPQLVREVPIKFEIWRIKLHSWLQHKLHHCHFTSNRFLAHIPYLDVCLSIPFIKRCTVDCKYNGGEITKRENAETRASFRCSFNDVVSQPFSF